MIGPGVMTLVLQECLLLSPPAIFPSSSRSVDVNPPLQSAAAVSAACPLVPPAAGSMLELKPFYDLCFASTTDSSGGGSVNYRLCTDWAPRTWVLDDSSTAPERELRVVMLRSFTHQTASRTSKSHLLLFHSSISAALKLKEDM